ncbi:MmgE/PrpD family protein [Blastococcus saxobsidens]|uniref:MmgE/PrpD N-terminal domain-containing protein n=1 Tax=Blastococcus saxobsidens (strain DD2) TaxID=1146883 RepID=H6RNM5_BLASD|nr:MmgE/PrpD family protein [Blastococcus saxobsidens]CCG05173.1 conserved protein of unknown function; MmgE/PrpD family [Blastococcus saxobsidens DD2]
MTVTGDLAASSRLPTDTAYLRVLTLNNIAAGAGDLGSSRRLVDQLRNTAPPSPGQDAFALATQLHARTQDDFFPAGRSHVGAVTLAAALALADESSDRFLESLAAGYRTMCAVARVYSADAQQRGYRPSGLFGAFGAAATAATALGMSADETANAIGLAAVMAGGTNQAWLDGSDEWLLEVGIAARAGVEAALLTRVGAMAAPEALEGDAGWSTAFFDDPGSARLTASMSAGAPSIAEIAVKPYPISGIAQVPTHLACAAHAWLAGRRPRSVVVRMSEAEVGYPGTLNRGPFRSRGQALMSVSHCVAAGLADGTVRLSRLDEPGPLASLADVVQVVPDATLSEMSAVLTVVTGDGTETFTGEGGALLFPTSESADVPALAAHCEAPRAVVQAAHDELAHDCPDAGFIRALLVDSGRARAQERNKR